MFFNTATLELENQLAEATSGFPSASKSVTTKPLGLAVVENGTWVAKLMVPLVVFLNTEIEDDPRLEAIKSILLSPSISAAAASHG